MRQTIHQQLIGTPALTAVIPTERWFQLGNVVDVPPLPFAILRWITPVAGDARGTWAHQLRVEVYDKRGSYKKIDDLLGDPYRSTPSVYNVLSQMVDVTGADGRVTQCDFLGNSGDDVNIDYRANFKYSSWQIIGRSA